jgi:hypothetical protein
MRTTTLVLGLLLLSARVLLGARVPPVGAGINLAAGITRK